MLRNRAKRKYETVAQEIQFSEFYRTAIFLKRGRQNTSVGILEYSNGNTPKRLWKYTDIHPYKVSSFSKRFRNFATVTKQA